MFDRYYVHNPDGQDLEFQGALVAEDMAEDVGIIKVYRTKAGKFVAKQQRSALRGRTAVDRVGVFDNLEALSEWLGPCTTAKRVLDKLGLRVSRKLN